MGYSTWNDLRCDGINAVNVMAVADKMFELGLHFAGYEYVRPYSASIFRNVFLFLHFLYSILDLFVSSMCRSTLMIAGLLAASQTPTSSFPTQLHSLMV